MPAEGTERATAAVGGGLDGRVLSTLQELRGRIAFSGLRRVLGAHPESLSRSLRRLEREGLVERTDGGYRAISAPGADRPVAPELKPIASVDLPVGVSRDFVHGRLAGRWFGSLRWVGRVERPDGALLAWAGRDGSGYTLLGIDRGVLRVYVPVDAAGDPTSDGEDSAYELLAHAIDALRPSATEGVGDVALFAARRGRPFGWMPEN